MAKKEVLQEEYRLMVLRDDDITYQLAKLNGVRIGSVQRWIRVNDEALTLAKNLTLIREHFGISSKVSLTEEIEYEEA